MSYLKLGQPEMFTLLCAVRLKSSGFRMEVESEVCSRSFMTRGPHGPYLHRL